MSRAKNEKTENEHKPTSTKHNKLEFILITLVIIASIFLVNSTMDPGHAWGGDFALYIEQAMALNDGSLNELYESNKYSMDNSPDGFGPYLYPMGFSILLAPVIQILGYDLLAMKWLCAFFLFLASFFLWKLLRNRFSHFLFPILITAVIATHYQYTLFSDNVLSDLPFFAFVMMSLYLIERSKSMTQWIAVGGLIFFSYLIRDVGIFLLASLAAWQWMRFKDDLSSKVNEPSVEKSKGINKSLIWLKIGLPYAIFGVLLLLSKLAFPSGAENHLAQFFGGELTSNLGYYGEQIDKFLLVKGYDSGSGAVLMFRSLVLFLFIYGMFKKGKESLHYLTFILLSIILYLLWPYTQGLRFLYPILPFVLFYAFQGLESLTARIKVKNIAIYIAIIICSFPILRSINSSMEQAPKTRNMVERKEIQDAFIYINENIPEDAIIGFHKPRVLRLYAGRNAVYHPFQQYAEVNADYVLVLRSPQELPMDMVYQNEAFVLYKNQQ